MSSENESGRRRDSPPRSAILKKEPAIGDGFQFGRRTTKVSRFAAALCVVIHTSGGKCEVAERWLSRGRWGERRLRPATRSIHDSGTSMEPQIT
jgi:hypothetical protein